MELCEATPSLVQSRRLKEMSQSGTLTEHYLHTLLTEQKPNQRQKFFLNQSDVQRFFPPGYTPEQMQNTIFSLLKTWGHAKRTPVPKATKNAGTTTTEYGNGVTSTRKAAAAPNGLKTAHTM